MRATPAFRAVNLSSRIETAASGTPAVRATMRKRRLPSGT
jgi:hypothetical protein